MKDVMCFDKKKDLYLDPLIEIGCDEMGRNGLPWTSCKIREYIPKLQKAWITLEAMEKWADELDSEGGTGKFIAQEIRRRMED
jgi:hypothetical protein